jgi:hypothetical protein
MTKTEINIGGGLSFVVFLVLQTVLLVLHYGRSTIFGVDWINLPWWIIWMPLLVIVLIICIILVVLIFVLILDYLTF